MKWIDAGDIKNWVNGKQRHSAQTLPELVRRLIFATAAAASIEEIEFPSGDSISTGGWDGRLKTSVVSPFFPTGLSGWEMGIENSPGRKADEDFEKRISDPQGLNANETTFVFVTPRPWPGRVKWQAGKRASGKWKEVQVIGGDALEQWLDSAPAVALWLAKQIGKVVSDDIRVLENVWEEWSLATNPTMTTDLVLGGRTRDAERIHKWLEDRPGVLSVQGDSPDEAVAFLYAAIAALPQMSRVRVFSRCVVVESISELRQLTQAFQNPLIIAAPGSCIEAAGAAVTKGHHVFLSMDAKLIDIGNIVRLSRPQRSIVEKNLSSNGLSATEAQRLARDFGRSIPVLRRHLYRSSAASAPMWANADSAAALLPVLFAGAWTDNKEGDRTVLEALSGRDYESFVRDLQPFLSLDDAPIRKVGNVWMLKSPLDAWFLLARHLRNDSLKRFQQVLTAVLTKTDPKYDLPAEERWAAKIYGKSSPYSGWLRTGLVESLVLLAVYGNRSPNVDSTQAFADRVVKDILVPAQTWEAWASIKDITPVLAEASPNTFIEIVQRGLTNTPKVFQELMQDDAGIFGECRHCGLLWGLESAAWSSEYFAGAVSVLTGLAKIDPGGRWSNRPIGSLKEIFLPGYPQTYASPQERLAAFDGLLESDPTMAWKFAGGYYSQGHFSESSRFRWRDAGGERRGQEPERTEDHQEYLRGFLPMLSALACSRLNLVSSVSAFTRLPADVRERLLTELENIGPASFTRDEREHLLKEIREVLNWINNYGGKDLHANLPALNRVLEKFEPEDVLQRVGWILSDPWPKLPEGEPKNYEDRDAAVLRAQEQAAREVLDKVPIANIVDYATKIRYPGVLGQALGKVVRDQEEDVVVLDAMLERIADTAGLITGYAVGRVKVTDRDWVIRQIERLKAAQNYSPEACGLLYLALPEGAETWSAVSAYGKEAEIAYWRRAHGRSQSNKTGDAQIAVEKFLDAQRPAAALEIAGDPQVSIPSSLLKRLIQEFLSAIQQKGGKVQANGMTGFYLGHVFNQLYERDELPIEELAQLEWPFASLFDELHRYTSSPLAIHRVLQRDPFFFAQLITLMYKRDDRSSDPSDEGIDKKGRENLAHNARQVLDDWRLMPGLKEDGSIDDKALTEWVEAVRQKCAETGHVTGGDLQIAFMLARAPADVDGVWPNIAVRSLIERLNNDLIDEHIQIGIHNSRGVVSRGLTDGGAQERDLAERYKKMSEAVKPKWPRTAAMLRSIANSYTRYAEHEDISSELNDLRWN